MRKISLCTVSLIIFFVSSSSYGQENSSKFGIGVTTTSIKEIIRVVSDGSNSIPTIYLPIDASANFRIEPEIGFISMSDDRDRDEDSYKRENSTSGIHLGIGIFPMNKYENYILYYGVRLAYVVYSSTNKYSSNGYSDKDESSSNAFSLAPTVGGEYMLSQYFSLGAEAQLVHTSSSGESKYTDSDDDTEKTDLSSSLTSVKALIFFRFYL